MIFKILLLEHEGTCESLYSTEEKASEAWEKTREKSNIIMRVLMVLKDGRWWLLQSNTTAPEI